MEHNLECGRYFFYNISINRNFSTILHEIWMLKKD